MNQLILPYKVLQNIIAHVILPRKGHWDKVNNLDLFVLDSFLVGRKDFLTVALGDMKLVYSTRHIKTLPYGMFLTKILKHFEISLYGETFVSLYPIGTINIQIVKCMKIVKGHAQ